VKREPDPAPVVEAESPPPLPNKPSIAVLPFQNLSGDPEQEYFVDGIAEDVLTTLSRSSNCWSYINFAKHTHAQARLELERALAINASFTPALHVLGLTLVDQVRFGWQKDETTTYEAALEQAARALTVDPNNYAAHVVIGYARLFQRRHNETLAAGEKAIALGPSCSDAYHMAGMFFGYAGDFRKSAEYEQQAQRLGPLARNESMVDEARAKFHLGNLSAARHCSARTCREAPLANSASDTRGITLESRQ
jgi:adenylate cyclase